MRFDVDQTGFVEEVYYSSERAAPAIRRRLAEARCLSAESLAGTLAHALCGWRPGRDAVGLVRSMADVDAATARSVVEGWAVGVDEHIRTLRHISQRHGVYTTEGQAYAGKARELAAHVAALRASIVVEPAAEVA